MASRVRLREISLLLRFRLHIINQFAMARRWRARHPLIVDMSTVVAAVVIFALLLADRQRLVEELACVTND